MASLFILDYQIALVMLRGSETSLIQKTMPSGIYSHFPSLFEVVMYQQTSVQFTFICVGRGDLFH